MNAINGICILDIKDSRLIVENNIITFNKVPIRAELSEIHSEDIILKLLNNEMKNNEQHNLLLLSGFLENEYRIPDELLHDQKILREIKNVSSQSYTNQLKDFNAWAKQNGYQFILEVRPGAKLSGPLQEAIKNGEIILKYIGQ